MSRNLVIKVKDGDEEILSISITSPVKLEVSVNDNTIVTPREVEVKEATNVKTGAEQKRQEDIQAEPEPEVEGGGEGEVSDEELFNEAMEDSSAPVEETSEKPPVKDVLTEFFNETDKHAVVLQKTVESQSKESAEKEKRAKEIVSELLGL